MNPGRMGRILLQGLGYSAFFLFFVLIFTVLSFPTDRARQFLEERGSAALGGDVRIGDLDLGFGSAELTDVALKLPPKPPRQRPGMPPGAQMPGQAGDGKPSVLQASRVALDASLFGLLFGADVEVEFEADLQGGTVRGGRLAYGDESGASLAIAEIRGVRIGPEGLFDRLVDYDLEGVLGGRLEVERGTAPHEIAGVVDLALGNARIVRPVIPTKQLGPLQLSDIDLGELQLRLEAGTASDLGMSRKGRFADRTLIHFTDVGANGDDLKVEFHDSSVIRLVEGQPLSRATLDVHFAVKFTDRFIDKRVTGEDGEVSQPNSFLRTALKQDARLRAASRDGVIGIACRGVLSQPDCTPEPPRIRGGFKQRAPRFTPDETEGDEEGEAPEEAEAGAEEPDNVRARGVQDEALERAREVRPQPRGGDEEPRFEETRRPSPAGRRARPTGDRQAIPRPTPKLEPPAVRTRRAAPEDEEEDYVDEEDEFYEDEEEY